MNTYQLLLKGTNKKLAILEFQILWKTYFTEEIELKQVTNMLYSFNSKNLLEKTHPLLKRLTLTSYLGIQKDFEKMNWKEYNEIPYLIRIKRSKHRLQTEKTERELAKKVWDLIPSPKVSLEKAQIEWNFIFHTERDFFFTEKLFENEKDYMRRMPVKRPISMPYTLKSDMARAGINLLGIKEGIVLDPFCGIGGILLEARDMNFTIIGNDISWNDLQHFKTNFNYYFPNKEEELYRVLADCETEFLKAECIDGIVTDIPYGKASRKLGLDLYRNVLKLMQKALKERKRAIIVYANFVEFKDLALEYFDEVDEIEHYINKSMTRRILILEKRKT